MSTLILSLPSNPFGPTTAYDYAVTPDDQTLSSHASALLALLPQGPRGADLVAVVPAELLSWHRVELPKGIGPGSARLLPVLHSLLEDRLLDDPSQLHLALEPDASAGQACWVAACDKAWLRSHLQAFEAAERPITRIVPELAAEGGATRLVAVGQPDQPRLLVTGHGHSGVLSLPLHAGALALLAPPAPPGSTPTSVAFTATTVFESEPAVAALAEQLLHHTPVLRQRHERLLQAANTAWDLAQFDLISSGRSRQAKRLRALGNNLRRAPAWRPARWGAGILVAANLLGLNAWAWREQSALEAQRQTIRASLTQTFPQIQVVVDAPLQMEREVAKLRQSTGTASGRDLETMLSALGAAMAPGTGAAAIEFNAGELRVSGLNLNSQEMPNLTARLRGMGYLARLDAGSLVLQQDPTQ